jgi:hypothetical protein
MFNSVSVLCARGYVSYKVDGVPYKLSEDQLISYSAASTDASDENKKLSKYLSIDLMDVSSVKYAIQLALHIDLKKKFEPREYKLNDEIEYYNVLPVGSLQLTKKIGDKYEFFRTEKGAVGNITVTKVGGKYIEGTFEGEVILQYPQTSKVPLKITEGKFKVVFGWQD